MSKYNACAQAKQPKHQYKKVFLYVFYERLAEALHHIQHQQLEGTSV
jgi:hypothetical protein